MAGCSQEQVHTVAQDVNQCRVFLQCPAHFAKEQTSKIGQGGSGNDDDPDPQRQDINQIDQRPGEEAAVFENIGLTMPQGVEGEGQVKRPRQSHAAQPERMIGAQVKETRTSKIGDDDQDSIEREKIGRERDEYVGFRQRDTTAIFGHFHALDAGAHGKAPECVGQFMGQNVGTQWRRQGEVEKYPEGKTDHKAPSGSVEPLQRLQRQYQLERRAGDGDAGGNHGQTGEEFQKSQH